jgi:hypothetical protein
MVESDVLPKVVVALIDLVILHQYYLTFEVVAKDHVYCGLALLIRIFLDKQVLGTAVEIVGLTYEDSL